MEKVSEYCQLVQTGLTQQIDPKMSILVTMSQSAASLLHRDLFKCEAIC